MSIRSKRVVLPLAGVLLVAIAVFLLGRFGVVDLPWTPPGDAVAEAGDDAGRESGTKHGKKGNDAEEEIVPVPVELARAEPRRISAFYRASSFVEADRLVDLVSKVGGRVQAVNVEEGDWVERGQVLAELENASEKIQLRQADLKLADQDRDLARRESMLAQHLVTQEEFDATRSARELALAERDLARIRVDDTILRAPFDGQVTARRIVPGQHVNPSDPLFTLVDFEPLRVRIHLPEIVARKIAAGESVQILAEALDGPVDAHVERIAPVVDPATSTVQITLRIEERAPELRVGGFVKVRVTTDTHTEALAVPKMALVEEGGLRSVFLAEADTVRKVEVSTGLYDESHVEVLDGVEEGAFVVSLGQGGLRTGSRIDVLNATMVGWVPPDSTGEGAGDDAESAEGDDDDAAAGGTGGETLADAGSDS